MKCVYIGMVRIHFDELPGIVSCCASHLYVVTSCRKRSMPWEMQDMSSFHADRPMLLWASLPVYQQRSVLADVKAVLGPLISWYHRTKVIKTCDNNSHFLDAIWCHWISMSNPAALVACLWWRQILTVFKGFVLLLASQIPVVVAGCPVPTWLSSKEPTVDSIGWPLW